MIGSIKNLTVRRVVLIVGFVPILVLAPLYHGVLQAAVVACEVVEDTISVWND